MASPAGTEGGRRQGNGLPEAGPIPRRATGQTCGAPAPLDIRWYRTLVPAKGASGGGVSSWMPVAVLPKPNRRKRHKLARPRPHIERARQVVEAAVRQALAGLDGAWSARTAPLKAYCVEIASPEGFRWLAFIPDPRRQGTRSVARRLRDGCRERPPSSRLTRWNKAWIIVTEGLS
jgi:hypothetical protein